MRIYYLPLEPLEQRYTKQWYEWFRKVFEGEGVDFVYLDGEKVKSKLGGKFFLDMKATFVWKFEQLKKLFKQELTSDDVIFIPDGEFAGIEAIEYFRRFYKVRPKIVEIWHAGTYDYWDLTSQVGLGRIGGKLEEVWFDIADLVFVATEFHKNLITENRIVDKSKIKVTGLPVAVEELAEKEVDWEKRKKRAVFTGRLSIEKGIDVVERIKNQKIPVFTTQKHSLSKERYYKELANSKVVFAPSKQETFGYGVVEGMALNVVPVVVDGLSFRDYVPRKFRYSTEEEAKEKIRRFIEGKKQNVRKYVRKYEWKRVIKKMLKEIESL